MLASLALAWYDVATARQRPVEDLRLRARVIGANTTGALAFGDTKSAGEILQGATVDPHVRIAAILNPNGQPFVRIDRNRGTAAEPLGVSNELVSAGQEWFAFDRDNVRVLQSVDLKGERTGWIFLESDLDGVHARERRHAGIIGIALFGGLLLAFVMSQWLQRLISSPILELTGITRAVRQDGQGFYSKVEYLQARGQHWRATLSGIVIAGRPDDFLGQYDRNSHVGVALRYSF